MKDQVRMLDYLKLQQSPLTVAKISSSLASSIANYQLYYKYIEKKLILEHNRIMISSIK